MDQPAPKPEPERTPPSLHLWLRSNLAKVSVDKLPPAPGGLGYRAWAPAKIGAVPNDGSVLLFTHVAPFYPPEGPNPPRTLAEFERRADRLHKFGRALERAGSRATAPFMDDAVPLEPLTPPARPLLMIRLVMMDARATHITRGAWLAAAVYWEISPGLVGLAAAGVDSGPARVAGPGYSAWAHTQLVAALGRVAVAPDTAPGLVVDGGWFPGVDMEMLGGLWDGFTSASSAPDRRPAAKQPSAC